MMLEIINTLFFVVVKLLDSIALGLIESLPAFLQLNKMLNVFSPTGVVLLSLGIPVAMICICITAIKLFKYIDKKTSKK